MLILFYLTNRFCFVLATVLGLARLLAVPLSRARMSKLVEPSEQGKLSHTHKEELYTIV